MTWSSVTGMKQNARFLYRACCWLCSSCHLTHYNPEIFIEPFWESSNDHIPYKYLCWACLALQNILGSLCSRYAEHRLKSRLQLNSPTLQKSKEPVGNVGTTLCVGHGKELLIRVLSKHSCVFYGMFRISVIWICPHRQVKLSESFHFATPVSFENGQSIF